MHDNLSVQATLEKENPPCFQDRRLVCAVASVAHTHGPRPEITHLIYGNGSVGRVWAADADKHQALDEAQSGHDHGAIPKQPAFNGPLSYGIIGLKEN